MGAFHLMPRVDKDLNVLSSIKFVGASGFVISKDPSSFRKGSLEILLVLI